MSLFRNRTALLWVPVLLLSALPFRAQADTPLSAEQILKQLDVIEKQHNAAQQGSLNGVLSEITGAEGDAQAALTLYQKAVFEVQFNGEKGDNEAFQSWKKEHDLLFHDATFTAALTLHLKFLELSIDDAKAGDSASLIDPLLEYLQNLWDFQAKNTADVAADADTPTHKSHKSRVYESDLTQNLLSQGISSSALAKYYQVDSLLSALKNWEGTPSNDDGILNTVVFPALRTAKNPHLIQIWDQWIDHETENSKANPLADQQEHFQTETLPKLRWSRALDLLALDRKDDAMAEMLDLIKTYPLHPDNASWITQLRNVATGQSPAAG